MGGFGLGGETADGGSNTFGIYSQSLSPGIGRSGEGRDGGGGGKVAASASSSVGSDLSLKDGGSSGEGSIMSSVGQGDLLPEPLRDINGDDLEAVLRQPAGMEEEEDVVSETLLRPPPPPALEGEGEGDEEGEGGGDGYANIVVPGEAALPSAPWSAERKIDVGSGSGSVGASDDIRLDVEVEPRAGRTEAQNESGDGLKAVAATGAPRVVIGGFYGGGASAAPHGRHARMDSGGVSPLVGLPFAISPRSVLDLPAGGVANRDFAAAIAGSRSTLAGKRGVAEGGGDEEEAVSDARGDSVAGSNSHSSGELGYSPTPSSAASGFALGGATASGRSNDDDDIEDESFQLITPPSGSAGRGDDVVGGEEERKLL